MKTVQVVFDEPLLDRLDAAAAAERVARSALIRDAVEQFLAQRRLEDLERQDREGYLRVPQTESEDEDWGAVQSWPDDWNDE